MMYTTVMDFLKGVNLILQTLTLNSSIKNVAAYLNIGSTLRIVAKEIGVSEKRLSSALKLAGYSYTNSSWNHKDYEDSKREMSVLDLINFEKADKSLHTSLQELSPFDRVTKRLAADSQTFDAFEKFCEDYELIHSRALTLALQEFMDKYSK